MPRFPSLTLLNGYTARLVAQNELNLREAWMRTELFGQRLALTAGRLDLTNYFDAERIRQRRKHAVHQRRAGEQPDAGPCDQRHRLCRRIRPKNGFRLKFGLAAEQHRRDEPVGLVIYTLTEVGYTFTPFALPEGGYRFWYRTDNTSEEAIRKAAGSAWIRSSRRSSAFSDDTASQETDLGGRPLLQRRRRVPERVWYSNPWTAGESGMRRWICVGR